MDRFYCERANGRLEYWTYTDAGPLVRVYVSEALVKRELARGRAVLIRL
jgi:hypothetical protein